MGKIKDKEARQAAAKANRAAKAAAKAEKEGTAPVEGASQTAAISVVSHGVHHQRSSA